jgi:hypothetical protein
MSGNFSEISVKKLCALCGEKINHKEHRGIQHKATEETTQRAQRNTMKTEAFTK